MLKKIMYAKSIFEYLMGTEGIQYPTSYDEALTLFSYLTNVAGD